MMGTTKIKLDKDLMEKVKNYAAKAGYSSMEEFVAHCLEKEIAKLDAIDSPEEIQKKLKGLGYIS
jgi:predicted transcriptional regulator